MEDLLPMQRGAASLASSFSRVGGPVRDGRGDFPRAPDRNHRDELRGCEKIDGINHRATEAQRGEAATSGYGLAKLPLTRRRMAATPSPRARVGNTFPSPLGSPISEP